MFKIIATFYTGKADVLREQISKKDQPAVSTTISESEKISSKVSKAAQALLPKAVQDVLASKDAQIEVKKGNQLGTIVPNADLEIVDGSHYPYLVEIAKAVSDGKDAKPLSKRTQTPASEIATSKHTDELTKLKINLFGKDVQMSPMKLIALLKATHLDQLRKIGQDSAVICGSGHWVRVADLEGDHAFPDSILVARFFYVFGKDYDVKAHGEPLDLVPAVFKAQSGDTVAASKALLMAHYLDAKNLMPLCSNCNGNKNANYLSWFVNHPKYGLGFVTAHFPLNYDSIVPRTKDGQGLGDAAMMYLYTQKALQDALFPIKVAVKTEDTEHAAMSLDQAKTVVAAQAKIALSKDEFAQLLALLSKV